MTLPIPNRQLGVASARPFSPDGREGGREVQPTDHAADQRASQPPCLPWRPGALAESSGCLGPQLSHRLQRPQGGLVTSVWHLSPAVPMNGGRIVLRPFIPFSFPLAVLALSCSVSGWAWVAMISAVCIYHRAVASGLEIFLGGEKAAPFGRGDVRSGIFGKDLGHFASLPGMVCSGTDGPYAVSLAECEAVM